MVEVELVELQILEEEVVVQQQELVELQVVGQVLSSLLIQPHKYLKNVVKCQYL
jgi:hypothetical protein